MEAVDMMRNTFSQFATLVVMLGAGCAVDSDDTVGASAQELGTAPVACFVDQGQVDPSVPLSRRFDSSCSTATSGSYIAYRTWDFGDGTGAFTGGTQTDHTFPFTNSCYKVHLTVWDANGLSADVFHYATFCSVGPCVPMCPP
jgi:hypothetical protein